MPAALSWGRCPTGLRVMSLAVSPTDNATPFQAHRAVKPETSFTGLVNLSSAQRGDSHPSPRCWWPGTQGLACRSCSISVPPRHDSRRSLPASSSRTLPPPAPSFAFHLPSDPQRVEPRDSNTGSRASLEAAGLRSEPMSLTLLTRVLHLIKTQPDREWT